MSKLHELLAVEEDLKGQAVTVRNQLAETFTKRQHLFEETRKTYTDNAEGSKPVVEEQKDIQSTVAKEVLWISEHLTKALDLGYQIDVANTTAKADVVTEDEEVLLKSVPTTALLRMQHRIREIEDLIKTIPTLDPALGFKPDDARGPGIYKAREVQEVRKRKENKVLTLAQATDKHPAQVQLVSVDTPVGTILKQEWSALITPSQKAELLNRAEKLLRAVKKARSRANDIETDVRGEKIGKTVLSYIFEPVVKLG